MMKDFGWTMPLRPASHLVVWTTHRLLDFENMYLHILRILIGKGKQSKVDV